jgi:hypothetical protein
MATTARSGSQAAYLLAPDTGTTVDGGMDTMVVQATGEAMSEGMDAATLPEEATHTATPLVDTIGRQFMAVGSMVGAASTAADTANGKLL